MRYLDGACEAYVSARVFDPLGVMATGFNESDIDRLVDNYRLFNKLGSFSAGVQHPEQLYRRRPFQAKSDFKKALMQVQYTSRARKK